MIFKKAILHNVSELEKTKSGYQMLRVPKATEMQLNDTAMRINRYSTGVEIRFIMKADCAKVTLKCHDEASIARAVIYFGNIAAGWKHCEKFITDKPTTITISRPDFNHLEEISNVCEYPFNPNVVRIILPPRNIEIIDIDENIETPTPEQLPENCCLFYGSSITNGSLALTPTDSFVYRIAESINVDYRNLGYAGSAHCEKAMAEYIASVRGLKFIGLAMGANMGGNDFNKVQYKDRIKPFIQTIANAHKSIPVFCVDQIFCDSDFNDDPWAKGHRLLLKETLNELNLSNTVYVDGTTIMSSCSGLSADFIHPMTTGIDEIHKNYLKIIKEHLNI